MMNKKFHIIIFSVMCISLVLLGFSYAKESGRNDNIFLAEDSHDNYRVVFSEDDEIDTFNNNISDISVINKNKNDTVYNLLLTERDGKNYDDVYYKINNNEEVKVVDGVVKLGSLSSYGKDGDHKTFHLTLNSKTDKNYTFKMVIKMADNYNIFNAIKSSKNVYTLENGDVRYYGISPNNYIKHNNELMRIIGVVNGKVRIISEVKGLQKFDVTNNYPTLNDYLLSFNNKDVNKDNVLMYTSWMSDKGYWLKDTIDDKAYFASKFYGVGLNLKSVNYYTRYVYEIDSNSTLNSGDGSINNPFEVTYGS